MKFFLCKNLSDDWRLRDEVRVFIYRYFRVKRWKSLNFGVEIGLYFVALYFLFWSFEIGVRIYDE